MLLITAETYSKYIHPGPTAACARFSAMRAAATLIEAADEPTLSAFQFGTDGTGADTLLVTKGGARPPAERSSRGIASAGRAICIWTGRA